MGGRLAVFVSLLFLVFSHLSVLFAATGDSINQTQSLRDDGGGALVSSNGRFVLGFFSPGVSRGRYLGIWYSFSNQTVVWVGNRNKPIPDSSGVLNLTADGAIALYQATTDSLVWSSGTPSGNLSAGSAVLLRLLDSGNLVVTSVINGAGTEATGGGTAPLWQSLDNPINMLLPTMTVRVNYRTGLNVSVTSWKSADDPSLGDYIAGFIRLDPRGLTEIYVRSTAPKTSSDWIKFRYGPWNGARFSGIPRMSSYSNGTKPMFRYLFASDEREAYYGFDVTNADTVARLVINPQGTVERFVWNSDKRVWTSYWAAPKDDCDAYAKCGPNGICTYEDPGLCQCYPGFQARSQSSWTARDFQSGCGRKEALNCSAGGNGLGFLIVSGVKLPDTSYATRNTTASLEACRDECLRNCSCSAYAANEISNDGSTKGCLMWFGDLIDTRIFTVDGQDLYLKVPASELRKFSVIFPPAKLLASLIYDYIY